MSDVEMSYFFKLPANEIVKVIDRNKTSLFNCDGVSEFQAIDVAVNAYDDNQALIKKQQEQIEELEAQDEWISVDNDLPQEDFEVDCCCDDDVETCVFRLFSDGSYLFEIVRSDLSFSATHWKPRPTPPTK